MSTTIIVHTSAADAVHHNVGCGWHPITVDFSTWDADERAWLAARVHETTRGPKLGDHRGGDNVVPKWSCAPTPEALRELVNAERLRAQADFRRRAESWREASPSTFVSCGSSMSTEEREVARQLGSTATTWAEYLDRTAEIEAYRLSVEAENAERRRADAKRIEAARRERSELEQARRVFLRKLLEADYPDEVACFDAGVVRESVLDDVARSVVAKAVVAALGEPARLSQPIAAAVRSRCLAADVRPCWEQQSTLTPAELRARDAVLAAAPAWFAAAAGYQMIADFEVWIERAIAVYACDPDSPNADEDGDVEVPLAKGCSMARVVVQCEVAGRVVTVRHVIDGGLRA